MATRRIKEWFFLATNVLRADGTTGGIRFRTKDKPSQQTMEDLVESAAFPTDSDDRAKLYTGAPIATGSEQGLVVLATDAQAKNNQAQLLDRSLVAQPHQLPTTENLNAAVLEDMPVQTMDISADGATTTRNKYQVRLSLGWLTWLVSRLFKAGGDIGEVPIKNSADDYDWSWGDLSQNAGFITNLLANTTFLNGLATSTDFIDYLISNNYFTDELAADSNFITELSNNSTFVTNITNNTVFKQNIETQDSITNSGAPDYKLKLVGDSAAPGNNKFYGTDNGGVKGFFDLQAFIDLNKDSGSGSLGLSDVSFTPVLNMTLSNVTGTYWYTKSFKNYTINYEMYVTISTGALAGSGILNLKLKGDVTSSTRAYNRVVSSAPLGHTMGDFLTTEGTPNNEVTIGTITSDGSSASPLYVIKGQISLLID